MKSSGWVIPFVNEWRWVESVNSGRNGIRGAWQSFEPSAFSVPGRSSTREDPPLRPTTCPYYVFLLLPPSPQFFLPAIQRIARFFRRDHFRSWCSSKMLCRLQDFSILWDFFEEIEREREKEREREIGMNIFFFFFFLIISFILFLFSSNSLWCFFFAIEKDSLEIDFFILVSKGRVTLRNFFFFYFCKEYFPFPRKFHEIKALQPTYSFQWKVIFFSFSVFFLFYLDTFGWFKQFTRNKCFGGFPFTFVLKARFPRGFRLSHLSN